MNAHSFKSVLWIAILVLTSAAFISTHGAVIDSPESHSIENGNTTSDESSESTIVVIAARIQRSASIESVENNSTESLESHEQRVKFPRPIPIQQKRGCNVTQNLEGVPTDGKLILPQYL